VTVCDERAEYANKERFPEADDIVVESFERVFDRLHIDENSYIVIVTRGHKCDEIVLERAVGTDAGYIGMIGSRRKTRTIMERLHLKGIAPEALKRVYSPIGVSIGAVTPEEISLSIVCELVKIRRLGPVSEAGHMTLSF
ncbi:MAG: XdhC family protein, partial [Phycisphaerales bacterium]